MTAPAGGAPVFAVSQPYPGLRPFEAHESYLFHGREAHTHALLQRLATERFLAVVGGSGGGKSSLVRAGLLPALYRGYLVGASSCWRIAVMRPGNAPLDELARALSAGTALGVEAARLREVCGRTSLGLAETVRQADLEPGENVLLVIDQFEELFRFASERRHEDGGAEANLFVQSVIEATDAYQGRLYVVLTMRSDYLGDCAQFSGLPEALNRGQYLIPHLSREQRRAAIEQPPLLAGVRIKPALVQRVLNDAGDDPSQLPVLQHALMRTFQCLRPGEREMGFAHYEAAGGIEGALDRHATDICGRLAPETRAMVEKLFRCLTTLEGRRAVRRPARLDRIYRVLGVDADPVGRARVDEAISAFAQPEHSLLVSSTGPHLRGDSVIDISHESLITKWTALGEWRVKETRSAEWYESVALDTLRFRTGEASPWRDPELTRALEHRSEGWNEAWALQYDANAEPPFTEVVRFLEASVATQQEERAQKEAQRRKEIDDAHRLATAQGRAKTLYRLFTGVLALLVIGLCGAGYWAWRQHEESKAAAERELELVAKVNQTAADQEALKERLRQASDDLARAQAAGASSEVQLRKVAELEKQLAASSAAETRARQQYQQTAPAPKGSEYDAAFKQIAGLQAQLKEVREERDTLREERDTLRDSMDTAATVRFRDAGYWKSRAETAEKQLAQAQTTTRDVPPDPLIMAISQYSFVRLRAAPFSGRVGLFIDDLERARSSTATLYVWLGEGKNMPQDFDDNQAQARVTKGALAGAGASVLRFQVRKQITLAQTQPLGQFVYESQPYRVVATGWAQNARPGGSDVLSLVIHPVRTPASAGK